MFKSSTFVILIVVQEAISYSDSASAVSSSIPAFSKKGDLLLIDEAVCEPIQTAANLSRSTVIFFKHNDMNDLRNILSSIAEDDVALKRDSSQQRRFIVVEGIFRNTGAVCPLPELLKLRAEFCYRLVIDETLSFGVLGTKGKGVTDHFGVAVTEVDILTVAMDTMLASVGGVCLGTREIVDHQRLAGAGYCFSASAPPFLSAVALVTLNELRRSTKQLDSLRSVVDLAVKSLDGLKGLIRLKTQPEILTPVIHLLLESKSSYSEEEKTMELLVKALLQRGVCACAPKFAREAGRRLISSGYRPTLRLIFRASLSPLEISQAVAAIQGAVDEIVFGKKASAGFFGFAQ